MTSKHWKIKIASTSDEKSACNFDFPMRRCQAILLHNWDIINDKMYSYLAFQKCWAIILHFPRDVQYYCSTPKTQLALILPIELWKLLDIIFIIELLCNNMYVFCSYLQRLLSALYCIYLKRARALLVVTWLSDIIMIGRSLIPRHLLLFFVLACLESCDQRI